VPRALWSLLVALAVMASGALARPAMAGCEARASKTAPCCGARHARSDAARLMRTCCCAVDAPIESAPVSPVGATTPPVVALTPPAIAVDVARADVPVRAAPGDVAAVALGPPRSLFGCAVALLL
jgi:hypothetical protein